MIKILITPFIFLLITSCLRKKGIDFASQESKKESVLSLSSNVSRSFNLSASYYLNNDGSSDFTETPDSNGNLYADPLFTSETAPSDAPSSEGGFSLQSESPAVNSGSSDCTDSTDDSDLASSTRCSGNNLDIGAYEYQE